MGASVSKNQAKEIANIVNDISQDTNTNQANIQSNWNNEIFQGCNITADSFSTHQSATNYIKAVQLSEALQNSHVVNNIAQKLAQEAKSSVGFLGIGFASASNAASTEANSTNIIKNSMNTTLNNISNVNNNFVCQNSTLNIKGAINIDQSGFSTIMSDQTVKNTQITDLSNSLTQDISQKASATVQGAVGFILALALLIGVMGYSLSKPLNSAGGKIVVSGGLAVGILILFAWLYSVNAPPLFTKPEVVFPYAFSGQNGTCKSDKKMVEIQPRKVVLDKPPLKYLYNVAVEPDSTPFASLLTLVIANRVGKTPASNNGYNAFTAQSINANFKTFVQSSAWWALRPNPGTAFPDLMTVCNVLIPSTSGDNQVDYVHSPGSLVFSTTCNGNPDDIPDDTPLENILALPNNEGFQAYCANQENASFARFVFCEAFGFNNNYYVRDSDVVSYVDDNGNVQYGRAADLVKQGKGKHILRITGVNYSDASLAMAGSVTVESEFGICPGVSYAISRNFKKWGFYILLFFILLLILWVCLKSVIWKPKGKGTTTSSASSSASSSGGSTVTAAPKQQTKKK